jgi:hypothetical protein
MMTNTVLNTQNPEVIKSYISLLLEQLTIDYKNTKEERKNIASLPFASDEEFTVLEEIELLTVDIRGYASQILVTGMVENQQQAIERLQSMRITDIPTIAQFYLEANDDYRQMKAYIRSLDYMRSLLLEYLYFKDVTTNTGNQKTLR